MSHHRKGRNPDANKLIIYHNPTGSATFDPRITTSISTTVIWETEVGRTVTTGTTHDLSYTPTAGLKKCTIKVVGGLSTITAIDCQSDLVTIRTQQLSKLTSLRALNVFGAINLQGSLAEIGQITDIIANPSGVFNLSGNISNLSRTLTRIRMPSMPPGVVGSLSDFPSTCYEIWFYACLGVVGDTIAHLVAIDDLRIQGNGWTAQQNTDVLLSAWSARANYTYASGIQFRISAPTGTSGTEPPAEGESNSDWSWNAGTSRHDPLTGYAASADLQNDFYSEGFKGWTVTIL